MSVTESIAEVIKRVDTVVLGKTHVISDVLTAILAGGHVLLEDVPGVGKTTLARAFSKVLGLSFSRVQFTSDLLPSDITGVQVYRRSSESFEFEEGPIFAQLVLADEINRTTPKTQSSLLEAMNENTVSVQRDTYPLPSPFIVIATQNPLDFHGTYPLPESQLDRFMVRLRIGYPDGDTERRILELGGRHSTVDTIETVMNPALFKSAFEQVDAVELGDPVRRYLLSLVDATRNHQNIRIGVSTRGALEFQRAVRARAFVSGRNYATPDDVKRLAISVLAHRIQLIGHGAQNSSSADAERVIQDVLNSVLVPL
jgi:MoxR-like ATPase